MACIIEAEKWGNSKIWGHKESCYPPGRKGDPYFDMNTFRNQVAEGGDSDLPLNDADKSWIKQAINDALYYHNLVVMSGAGNSAVNTGNYPEYFDGDHSSNQAVIDELKG